MAGAAAGPRDYDVGLGAPVDRQQGLAVVGLLAVAGVWGITFSAVKDAVGAMPATDFLAIRFTVAAAVMMLVRPSALRHVDAATLRHGVPLGIVLAGGYLAQTVGLERTTPAVSGVLTGLVVVIAALAVAAITRTHVSPGGWAGVVLGAAAVGVLATRAGGLGAGEALTLLAAAVLAGHLVAVALVAERHDLWTLTLIQLVTAATVLAVLATPGGITTPPDAGVWVDVLVAGVLATAVAYAVQAWAQRRLQPARVGVVLATEPAFAVLAALWLAGESLSWPLVAGAGAVVAAMVLTELGAAREPALST